MEFERHIFGSMINGVNTNNYFPLSTKLNSEKIFSGLYTTDICNEEVKQFDILYYNLKDKGWYRARGDNIKTVPAQGLALENSFSRHKIKILLYGGVFNSDWDFFSDILNHNLIVFLDQFQYGKITTNITDRISNYRNPIGYIQGPSQVFFHFYGLWMYNDDEGFV